MHIYYQRLRRYRYNHIIRVVVKLVSRLLWEQETVGSSPAYPTKSVENKM